MAGEMKKNVPLVQIKGTVRSVFSHICISFSYFPPRVQCQVSFFLWLPTFWSQYETFCDLLRSIGKCWVFTDLFLSSKGFITWSPHQKIWMFFDTFSVQLFSAGMMHELSFCFLFSCKILKRVFKWKNNKQTCILSWGCLQLITSTWYYLG